MNVRSPTPQSPTSTTVQTTRCRGVGDAGIRRSRIAERSGRASPRQIITPMINSTGIACWIPVVGSQSGIHVVVGRTE